MLTPLKSASATNVGLVRDNNEDCYLSRPDLGLWLVADGMGGHEAGEIASALVKEHIEKAISQGEMLEKAIYESHGAVQQAAANNIGSPNMGTTVVALQVKSITYKVAWVGDSRAYLWRDGELSQISTDHSYVQQLYESGAISKEEMTNHAQRNVITQSLGVSTLDNVQVDVVEGLFEPQQKILLCSDGLSDLLSDQEIAAVLEKNYLSEEEQVNKLIDSALKKGGHDNVTVQIISAPPKQTFLQKLKRGWYKRAFRTASSSRSIA